MYGYDQFLIASALALLIIALGSLFLQRYIAIYDIYMGRKHALIGHIVLMSLALLQLLGLTVFGIKSRWLFTAVFWPLGALIFAASLYFLVIAIQESGPGALVGASLFGHHKPKRGKLAKRFKQPIAIGLAGVYLGLALLTGHIAYLITAVILGLGFFGLSVAISAMHPRS